MLLRSVSLQLFIALLVVAGGLTSIIWLTQALRFIDFIVNKGVSLFTFLKLTSLMLPSLLFIILPFAAFVAVLFVYHRMESDSELVVLRSAGLSRWQLARPAMVVGSGALLFSLLLSLYLMPVTYREFKDMQSFLRDNYASLLLQEGVFSSPVKGLTVFVRERGSSNELRGLLVHDNRDNSAPITMMAQAGRMENTPSGPRFYLFSGNRQQVQNGRLSYLAFDEYVIDLSFYAKVGKDRTRKPEEYFIHELLSSGEDTELRAELHHRLSWPFYSLVMALLSYVILVRGEFNRRGQAKRLGGSVLLALVVIASALSLQNMVAKQPQFTPLLYVMVLVWLGLSIALMSHYTLPLRRSGSAAQGRRPA